MSFGFGISDFIAVAKLIKDVGSCLDQIKHAASDYQELCRELENLKRALNHVDKLPVAPDKNNVVVAIKLAALSCRHPLTEFYKKIQKYDTRLSLRQSKRRVWDWKASVQWSSLDTEVLQLRHYLSLHVGTINMMLTTHGLEVLNTTVNQVIANQEALQVITRDVQEQGQRLTADKSLLSQLLSVVVDDIVPQLSRLMDIAERMSRSNLDIFTLVFKMQSNTQLCTSPTMWRQEPIQLEDACGRTIVVPSEYDYHKVTAIIKVQFSTGPGRRTVLSNRYELRNVRNINLDITADDFSGFLPGAYIKMAALVSGSASDGCPRPDCDSQTFKDGANQHRICLECGTWFGGAKRKRKYELATILDEDTRNQPPKKRRLSDTTRRSSARPDVERSKETEEETEDEVEDDLSVFKNILFDQSRLQTSGSPVLQNQKYTKNHYDLVSLAQSVQSSAIFSKGPSGSRHLFGIFLGKNFVTWLIDHFLDLHSRDEAVKFGNELLEIGLFRHIGQARCLFYDDEHFYQINDEYRVEMEPSLSEVAGLITILYWYDNKVVRIA